MLEVNPAQQRTFQAQAGTYPLKEEPQYFIHYTAGLVMWLVEDHSIAAAFYCNLILFHCLPLNEQSVMLHITNTGKRLGD